MLAIILVLNYNKTYYSLLVFVDYMKYFAITWNLF